MLMTPEVLGAWCVLFFFFFNSEHQALDSRWQCEMRNLSLGSDLLETSPVKMAF